MDGVKHRIETNSKYRGVMLRLGKRYYDREGSVVRIVKETKGAGTKFIGDNGKAYFEFGNVYMFDTDDDLIDEAGNDGVGHIRLLFIDTGDGKPTHYGWEFLPVVKDTSHD